ncbi:MAG TPA: hypothetical protein VK021_08820 [Flavobacteriaceae bacterium]|nr:hypothetical protein [Flavobacteriaceae bacterium]
MRNVVKLFLIFIVLGIGIHQADGQIYKNAIGLSIDAGDGSTAVGPSYKHFFDARNAGQIELLFADNLTIIQPSYSFNKGIPGAAGLNWLVGIGPAIGLSSGSSNVAIRPKVGLEYKINSVPLGFSFGWEPAFWLAHDADNNVARFGIGFNYTF